ncbi:MAG: DUF2007 domain-containing protein [Opitutae bacterium]|nr:DUF2007 domain-containing protein [Opitutae bacterium]
MTTIATVNKAEEAHLIRALLEGSGLAAFVRDEFMVTNDPLAVVALGGIKVDVNDEDAPRAREILASGGQGAPAEM